MSKVPKDKKKVICDKHYKKVPRIDVQYNMV